MEKANPLISEGARLERKAVRAYLRRQLERVRDDIHIEYATNVLEEALNWILARQKRYDARKGGLGRS
jgi:hypothetical protein